VNLPCLVRWPEDRQRVPRLDQLALLDLPVLLNTPIYLPSATFQAVVSDPAAELVGTIPMIHTYSTDPVNTVTENTFHCLSMKLNTHNSNETCMICVLWGLLGRLCMYPHHNVVKLHPKCWHYNCTFMFPRSFKKNMFGSRWIIANVKQEGRMRREREGGGEYTRNGVYTAYRKSFLVILLFFKRHTNKHTHDLTLNITLLCYWSLLFTQELEGLGLILFTWSSNIPKYCSSGDVCPCGVGTCWNLWIVWGVRRIPLGAFAATCNKLYWK